MKLFKPKFTDKKTGKTKTCQHFYLTFVDNRKIRRRLPAYSNKGASEKLGQKVDELLSSGGVLTPDLQRWVENLPTKQREALVKCGVIDSQRISSHMGKSLEEHLKDFGSALAVEDCPEYASQYKANIEIIFNGCGFKTYSDIDANRVYTFLGDLKKGEKDKKGIGQRTFNYYLKGCKQFCRWMIKERRATTNPLEHLNCITQTEKRRQRRALTLDEQLKLLQAAQNGVTHHNLTGYERSLVYRLALQTGLRAGELGSLTVSSFDLNERTVTILGAYSKNRKTDVIGLKKETTEELRAYLANKLPNVKVFAMPDQPSKMIKIDLEAAKIPYKTEEGQADFHSLRHSFITNLARSGVQPYEAMALARHSSITLTMNLYTHTKRESLRKIIDEQPDLTVRQENKKIG